MKRARATSLDFVDNPYIKPRNKTWRLDPPASFQARVSPPPVHKDQEDGQDKRPAATTAAVEAGAVDINDHVAFFSQKLLAFTSPEISGVPRLAHRDWLDLYERNQDDGGHHFVIHQHDHPVAGTHYDLRLQCNATSSISFAIMYGLPGDPNSRHLNRNAAETRVHNLWVCPSHIRGQHSLNG